jgi:hypothetical protein
MIMKSMEGRIAEVIEAIKYIQWFINELASEAVARWPRCFA